MKSTDCTSDLVESVREARAKCTPINIVGTGSKSFYGESEQARQALELNITSHSGIINYEPSELVVRVRAGTSLTDLKRTLAAQGQVLPFDPPQYSGTGTVGGCVAAGLSGPGRILFGSIRDSVLGATIINGRGEALTFGGQVMKNVAGYDVSRLMVGAMGTLGVLLDVSFKVSPRPEVEITIRASVQPERLRESLLELHQTQLPVSGVAYFDKSLSVRLSSTESGVRSAGDRLQGDEIEDGGFWDDLRDHRHGYFQDIEDLWRVVVPTGAPFARAPELVEWTGALRWFKSADDSIRQMAVDCGGHATLFKRQRSTLSSFQPLDPVAMEIHRRLKKSFDPDGVLNPGRMYRGI